MAIVGVNGAGKSTFIKILCGLYKTYEGEILLNDIDIRQFDPTEYFKLFSPIFQNIELFTLTLGENIAMSSKRFINKDLAITSIKKSRIREKIRLITG